MSTKKQAQSPSKIKAVVYTATRNLYPHLKATIYSLLEHNDIGRVYLLIEDDVFPYELPKQCITINVKGQPYFDADTCANWNTPFTYMALIRVAYTKYITDVDRILQLDCDTIITGDISELWDIDLTDKYFAACPEHLGSWCPYGQTYYNAGVCMFNLKAIRENHIDDALIELLNNKQLTYIDQDAWNIYASDRAVSIDIKYNECFVTGTSDDTRIVHFAGMKLWWEPGHNRTEWEPDCPKNYLYNNYGDFE